MECGQQTHNKLHMVLLDWEKAFDKVDREGLIIALKRMGVDKKIRKVIENLYENTQFIVEIEGVESEWTQQATGIRQGCPLSPYLFLVVMTVLFHDVHEITEAGMVGNRPNGATCDEVMYADDTICIATNTRQMNKFIETIEELGLEYGLKLNYKKCELVTTETNPNVHFKNGTKVQKKNEVTYLGCDLNMEGNMYKELSKKIAITMQALKKLDIFWRHSNCTIRRKLILADAVFRSKVLYGIDSAQLNEPELKRLDTFQLKIFRKILKMKTTYVERRNTNKEVLRRVQEQVEREKPRAKIKSFRESYRKSKQKRLARAIKKTDTEIQNVTFRNREKLETWTNINRKKGRPKYRWTEKAIEEMWAEVKAKHAEFQYTNFNKENEHMIRAMVEHATQL